MSKYVILKSNNKNATYLRIVAPQGYGQTYKNIIGLGNYEKLKEINLNALEIMRAKLREIPEETDPKILKKILINEIGTNEEFIYKNVGIELIYKTVSDLNIFDSFEKTRRKNQESILKYQIASKILNNQSIIKSFMRKDKYKNDISTQKDTFYDLLSDLVKNEHSIMKHLNNIISSKSSRNSQLLFFDSTTVYFESFTRSGLRKPGYSKDGKFKEDQVVIGMATDNNGIPIYLDVLPGNTSDSNTLMPFFIKLKKFYNIKNITVIADKGMSTNKNLRFLENLGINYIISHRLKQSTKEFKNYVVDKKDYKQIHENLWYKEMDYESMWDKGRPNGVIRKRIITHSTSRMKKDKMNREILVNNFNKKADNKGIVKASDMMGSKKHKFFKEVGQSFYVLDIEKQIEDEKYDGYYVYETTRNDLSPNEIISIYHHQWQIEENFRTLKTQFKVRPIYVYKDEHIKGHFILNFLSLVVIKYMLNLTNEFIKKNGMLYRITNNKFIDAVNSANIIECWKGDKLIRKTEARIENDIDSIKDYELIKLAINSI